jgi:hypothetical protein
MLLHANNSSAGRYKKKKTIRVKKIALKFIIRLEIIPRKINLRKPCINYYSEVKNPTKKKI